MSEDRLIANYLKIAFRNILRHKCYSFLNITGLAMCMACSILLAIYIHFEFSFSRYHANIHSVIGKHKFAGPFLYFYIFSAIALFILLIMCVNFMIMAMASSSSRTLEMGMRKILGAGRWELITQFLVESLLFSFIALIIALVLVECTLPLISSLAKRPLNFHIAEMPWLIPGIIFLALFMGLISVVFLLFKEKT